MAEPFVVAVTGHRDLHPEDRPLVQARCTLLLQRRLPTLIRFGGAAGADTFALQAFADWLVTPYGSGDASLTPKLAIYWPFAELPSGWTHRRWELANEIVLLGLGRGVPQIKSPYLWRNDALLAGCAGFAAPALGGVALPEGRDGPVVSAFAPLARDHPLHGRRQADLLLAFWDGVSGGKTAGGTAYTVRLAGRLGVPVEHVQVRRTG